MIKLFFAVITGKLILFLSRILGKGGGSAAPGLYALKIDPTLVSKLSSQIKKSVLITGTNGKTTTARLLDLFAAQSGMKVIRNNTGSNMERGIASSLIKSVNPFTLKIKNKDLGVWEIDEANLKNLIFKVKPQIVIFLNAARDQLDRYGELDSLTKEWREALEKVNFHPLILVNNDDAGTQSLTTLKNISFETFGTDKRIVEWEKESKVLGKADILASQIKENGLDGVEFSIKIGKDTQKMSFPVSGAYHIYDILAASAAATHLGISLLTISEVLKTYTPAFGRVERITFKGREIITALIKNPNGATQVFKTISPILKPEDSLLMALNDNIADGKDVSWIWDAEFEKLALGKQTIICSGNRALDLSLRLKYAGIDEKNITAEEDLGKATKKAFAQTKGKLFILPTYTALLELQDVLKKMGVKEAYWKNS